MLKIIGQYQEYWTTSGPEIRKAYVCKINSETSMIFDLHQAWSYSMNKLFDIWKVILLFCTRYLSISVTKRPICNIHRWETPVFSQLLVFLA